MKLEVGKKYELNDGRIVTIGAAENPDDGFYVDDLGLSREDGTFGYGNIHCSDLNVKRCVSDETGTLKELGVKPGDVVEYHGNVWRKTVENVISDIVTMTDGTSYFSNTLIFRIISRASDTPKTWGEMTDEEKGALLLAAHEGKVIEYGYGGPDFCHIKPNDGRWHSEYTYRVRPETKRDTVTMTGAPDDGFSLIGETYDTHRITFDTIDGKPDCGSIQMDEL